MAVPIRAGQWGRSEGYGWSTVAATQSVNVGWLNLEFRHDGLRRLTTFRESGMYVDGEESPGLDIIEVSDTDPRAPKAETRTMIDVSKLEEVLEVWRKGVTQVKMQCGVNYRSKMVIGSVERCIDDIEIVISLFAEKDGVK